MRWEVSAMRNVDVTAAANDDLIRLELHPLQPGSFGFHLDVHEEGDPASGADFDFQGEAWPDSTRTAELE